MKDHWVGQGVDLDLLGQWVKQFFEEKRFVVRLDKLKNESRVYGMPIDRDPDKGSGPVQIKIIGSSEDFTIEFVPGESYSELRILGPLFSLFGGGQIWLRELKTREFFEKLEEQFWAAMDEAIVSLRGTASAR